MRDRHTPQSSSIIVGFFGDLVKRVRGFTLLPESVAMVSNPGERQLVRGGARRTASARTSIWPLLLGFVLVVAAIPAWANQPTLPAGVPNIYDPGVLAHFQAEGVANLDGNPDFPLLVLRSTDGGHPQSVLLALDARNGKETWSLTADPIILIVVFSGETTTPGLYVDTGFADQGEPSGTYAALDQRDLGALPELLKAVTAARTETSI
jgi:hypothetical protein